MEHSGRGGHKVPLEKYELVKNHDFALKIKILFLVGSCKMVSKKNCHSGLRSQKSKLAALEPV